MAVAAEWYLLWKKHPVSDRYLEHRPRIAPVLKPKKNPKAKELIEAAKAVHANAYAPYSKFHVGCAVLSAKGEIYAACNVENMSYPVGTCAERNALAKAIASEGPSFKLAALALVAYRGRRRVACAPCGACRQAISEFGHSAQIIFDNGSGTLEGESASSLLPHSFALPD